VRQTDEPISQDSTRLEFLAIPLIGVILGIIALVMFAAVEGPWAWIVLGIGLVLLLAFVVRYASKRYPRMWDEAPANEDASGQHEHTA
jgi:F0F1-type ATP synthase assembly protein I